MARGREPGRRAEMVCRLQRQANGIRRQPRVNLDALTWMTASCPGQQASTRFHRRAQVGRQFCQGCEGWERLAVSLVADLGSWRDEEQPIRRQGLDGVA